jgi:tetratricopeptide (TPR) repeat protein
MMRWLVTLLALVVLGSCAVAPPRPVLVDEPLPAAVVAPSRVGLLAEIRAAANDAGDVIDVQPLRDPVVDDLLARAAGFERAGNLVAAADMLQQALQYAPDDPQLMQEHAELLLAIDRLEDAEQLAARSFASGPQLGGLCRRNWTTVQLARYHRGDADGAAEAAQRVSRCIVEPQLRM